METAKLLNEIGETVQKETPKKPGDFVGADGLLYCGTCRSVKQARVMVNGVPTVFAAACECFANDDAKREETKKKAAREETRKKVFHGIDSLCAATFERDDGKLPAVVEQLRKYVEIFDTAKADGYGIILSGPPGTGKTHHACQVANALIDRGRSVAFTDFYHLEGEISSSRDRTGTIEALARRDLVVLDDFGAWTKSAYDSGMICQLIDLLYLHKTPTVITTNMSAADLRAQSGTALFRRILERGRLIKLDDTVNRSKQLAKSNAEKYGAMLSP